MAEGKFNYNTSTELYTFLPEDGSNLKNGDLITDHEVEAASPDAKTVKQSLGETVFNPFLEREVKNPTTDCDTLTHLLKASLGTGILAMPIAFKHAGLLSGVFATIFVGLICTHCAYILVKCSHVLYYRTKRKQMDFADVAEVTFITGPKWGRKFSKSFRYFVQICLFVGYFGTLSVYTVIIVKNFQQVLQFYSHETMSDRSLIACLLVPLIFLCWIPDLKYLAPVSMMANLLMGTSLGITFYYLVKNIQPLNEISLTGSFDSFPNFFSITVFAMNAIGVIMPLENKMKTPQHFVGIFGVLNRGMFGVTFIYILLGFLGYCAYSNNTADSITLNLPIEEIPAQIVKVLIGLAVFFTFALQFFVCLDIVWNAIKHRFERKPILANYVLRTVIVTLSILLAIAVPTIEPFIGLIGAFCFSILGLLVPVIIETVTFWGIGFGRGNWMIVKNATICIVGLLALVFGTKSAIADILKLYTAESKAIGNATTVENFFNTTTESFFESTTIIS